jgi:hypothetical protein
MSPGVCGLIQRSRFHNVPCENHRVSSEILASPRYAFLILVPLSAIVVKWLSKS